MHCLAPRHDNQGYVLGLTISEELFEARIELNVCYGVLLKSNRKVTMRARERRTIFERLLALLKRVSVLADTLQHLPKGVSA